MLILDLVDRFKGMPNFDAHPVSRNNYICKHDLLWCHCEVYNAWGPKLLTNYWPMVCSVKGVLTWNNNRMKSWIIWYYFLLCFFSNTFVLIMLQLCKLFRSETTFTCFSQNFNLGTIGISYRYKSKSKLEKVSNNVTAKHVSRDAIWL